MNNPLSDALGIIKKDWKLLAGLNALYFCVLVIGATLAFISPGLHLSMIDLVGSDNIGGHVPAGASLTEALATATGGLASSFLLNTLGMITIPSAILPLWGPIIGSARFFIWGVTNVLPPDGVMTMGDLLPRYVAILLEGEAYVVAIFACVRQMVVAFENMYGDIRVMLGIYAVAVLENLQLLIVVFILLVAAALYKAFIIPWLG